MASRDVTIFIRAVDRATRVLNGISRGGAMALKGLAVGVTAATAAVTGLSMAYVGLIKTGIQYNAQMERFQATLETTMKSQERATKSIIWAKKFAAETPFQIPEVIEATVRLETYGLAATKSLKQIGNMAAIMGKPLMMAIEAIADAQTGELERLKEFGITKKMLIEAGMEVNARGQVKDFEQLNATMFKIMDDRFTGGMQKMMKGFTGVVSNLQDVWGQITGALAKPMFDKVKKELFSLIGAIDKFKKSGKMDKLLESWGKAGVNAFNAIIAAFKQVVPVILPWLQQAGVALTNFTASFKPEAIISFTKKIVAMITAIIKVSINVSKFVIENWKLVAALAAMTIIAKITSMILTMAKSISMVVIAIKGWIIANTALLASLGPTGLILALIAATTALAIWITKSDKAAKSATELGKAMVDKKMKDFGDETANANSRIAMLKISIDKATKAHAGHKKRLQAVNIQLKTNTISYKEWLVSVNKEIKAKVYLNELTEALKRLQAQQKAGKPLGPPLPPGYEERLRARKKEEKEAKRIAIFMKELEVELTIATNSEAENRKRKITEQFDEYKKRAKGNAEALKLIAKLRVIEIGKMNNEEAEAFAKAQDDKIKKAKEAAESIVNSQRQAWKTIMNLIGNEAALREAAIEDAYNKTLEGTKNIQIAEAVVAAMRRKFAEDDAKIVKGEKKAKLQIAREINMTVLEAEGKTHQIRMLRITDEINAMKEKGASEEQVSKFLAGKLLQMYNEIINAKNDKDEKAAKKREIRNEQLAAEVLRIETTLRDSLIVSDDMAFQHKMNQLGLEVEAYRQKGVDQGLVAAFFHQEVIRLKEEETQRFIDLEMQKINIMTGLYREYFGIALQLSDILFRAQDVGWAGTVASLVRFGTRMLAQYLQGLAMEKLKQASEAKTAAKSARYHALEMARLAAKNAVLALTATAMGNFAAAAGHAAAATKAGISAAAGFVEAGLLEAESAMLTAGASAMMVGAVAVEAAGELAAKGIEHAARVAEDASRKVEERKVLELKLQNEILEAQGRGHEVRMRQIGAEVARFRKAGADVSLVSEWQRAMNEQEAERARKEAGGISTMPRTSTTTTVAGKSSVPSTITPIIVSGGIGTAGEGPQTVIYQTNYFNNLIDTAKQDDLRELAFLLSPFSKEIEDLSRE